MLGARRHSPIFLAPRRCFCYVLGSIEMAAIMKNFDSERAVASGSPKWEGLAEIDQAIRDNRVMEYRIKKSWADPWSRTLSIGVVLILALFAGFVIYWDILRA